MGGDLGGPIEDGGNIYDYVELVRALRTGRRDPEYEEARKTAQHAHNYVSRGKKYVASDLFCTKSHFNLLKWTKSSKIVHTQRWSKLFANFQSDQH